MGSRSSLPRLLLATAAIVVLAPFAAAAPAGSQDAPLEPEPFVRAAYEGLLGREPDPGGLEFWTGRLQSGVPPADVAGFLATTAEHREHLAEEAYQRFLDREPDSAGLAWWREALSGEVSATAMHVSMVGSDEYYSEAGGTPDGFLQAAYQDILNRAPDPGGLSFWTQALADGTPRWIVAALLMLSEEATAQPGLSITSSTPAAYTTTSDLDRITVALDTGVVAEASTVLVRVAGELLAGEVSATSGDRLRFTATDPVTWVEAGRSVTAVVTVVAYDGTVVDRADYQFVYEAPTLPGGPLVRCANPEGFTVGVPASWSTNPGDVVPACSMFDPRPFEVPAGTDERVAAISAYVDPVTFADVAAPDPQRVEESRAVTTIDGLQAVRIEYRTADDGLWPQGTPVTVYAVDLSPGVDDGAGTLFLDTVGLTGSDYETNQVVLDRMARSVDVALPGVPGEPQVVARYEGGGGGFTVTGEVTGTQACLRIPPNGEAVCTDVPAPAALHTIQLDDLGPVLAGVTGEDVFRVTVTRRDGTTSSALPAPIPESGVSAFSFTFGLAGVERLELFDVTGGRLEVIVPGAA